MKKLTFEEWLLKHESMDLKTFKEIYLVHPLNSEFLKIPKYIRDRIRTPIQKSEVFFTLFEECESQIPYMYEAYITYKDYISRCLKDDIAYTIAEYTYEESSEYDPNYVIWSNMCSRISSRVPINIHAIPKGLWADKKLEIHYLLEVGKAYFQKLKAEYESNSTSAVQSS